MQLPRMPSTMHSALLLVALAVSSALPPTIAQGQTYRHKLRQQILAVADTPSPSSTDTPVVVAISGTLSPSAEVNRYTWLYPACYTSTTSSTASSNANSDGSTTTIGSSNVARCYDQVLGIVTLNKYCSGQRYRKTGCVGGAQGGAGVSGAVADQLFGTEISTNQSAYETGALEQQQQTTIVPSAVSIENGIAPTFSFTPVTSLPDSGAITTTFGPAVTAAATTSPATGQNEVTATDSATLLYPTQDPHSEVTPATVPPFTQIIPTFTSTGGFQQAGTVCGSATLNGPDCENPDCFWQGGFQACAGSPATSAAAAQ